MFTIYSTAILALTGCQSQPMLTVSRTVDVPIRGTCIAEADIPAVPEPTKPEGDEAQGVAALAADAIELTRYARVVDALLRGCAK